MPDVQYPFIDIAVHPRIRERFARGEALALFSTDLRHALWANGRGAALFGAPIIYDLIEKGPDTDDLVFRQFTSASRRLATTGDSAQFSIRVRNGLKSRATVATVELIETMNGEKAVLFSAEPVEKRQSAAECARQMLEGFDDPDTHMAVLDGEGSVLAASPGFMALGLTGHMTGALVTMAANSPERLIKRPVATGKGYLPAAIGALSSSPALNLLFAIETTPVVVEEEPEIPATDDNLPEISIENAPEIASAAAYDEAIDAVCGIEDVEEADDETDAVTESGLAQPDTPLTGEEAVTPVPGGFVFDPAARATRFVWKIDSAGRFSDVSHEFADAVGPGMADVSGRTFGEIAARLDIDPDGKIAELLGKRDTWSGKTIYWPVEGTRLRVPVDLAALPTYTRAREFDGFRGFGIVRSSDAIDDPLETGLAFATTEQHPGAEAMEDVASIGTQPEPAEDAAHEVLPVEDASDVAVAAEDDTTDGIETVGETEAPQDTRTFEVPVPEEWPEGEVPALRITPTPARRYQDNVIRVEELRARARMNEGLTPGERAAFYEIARKLGPATTVEVEEEPQDVAETAAVEDEAPLTAMEEPAPEIIAEEPAAEGEEPPVAEQQPVVEEPAEEVVTPPTELASVGRGRTLNAVILDEMPVALLVHTGDTLLHANPEFLRLTGYASLDELANAGGIDALLQRHELDDMPERTGGMVAVGANDELIPVTARLQSVRWEESSALMLALLPSGTPREQAPATAEEAVENEETAPDIDATPDDAVEGVEGLRIEVEELRSILETATDGVVILDEDGNIRSMNRSASALFNYDNHETTGKPFVILFAHESQKSILDYLALLAGHSAASVLNDGREVIGREASGGFLPLFMTIGRLKSSHGYCAVIRDVTQWKRTEEELRNARRSAEVANAHKSDFLAKVSHEIRTPLNAIIGFADMMATERFGPVGHPRYVEYANDIGRSGRHVLDIVNDLLDISKIEAGQMDLEFVAVGLNETVSETVSLVQPQANNQRVIIRTSLSPLVPRVVADIRSIRQIVLNILSNAIRFTPSGGQIVVSTSYEANGNVVLRFRDTGIGMTRTELEQAMKPFRQVASGTRLRGDGTGLGLPLTKAMVDANRATFSINSAPNEGTLVEIVFPPARVLAN